MTRPTILSTTLLALAVLAPRGADAQAQPFPEPGARVRIAAQSPTGHWEITVGTLVAAEGDSLLLHADGGSAPLVLRAGRVGAMQVSTGLEPRRNSALRTGAAAAVTGVVVGALIGVFSDGEGWELPGSGAVGKPGATLGWLAGIAGMLHGHRTPRERWGPPVVPGASARIGASADGGVAVSISLPLNPPLPRTRGTTMTRTPILLNGIVGALRGPREAWHRVAFPAAFAPTSGFDPDE